MQFNFDHTYRGQEKLRREAALSAAKAAGWRVADSTPADGGGFIIHLRPPQGVEVEIAGDRVIGHPDIYIVF